MKNLDDIIKDAKKIPSCADESGNDADKDKNDKNEHKS